MNTILVEIKGGILQQVISNEPIKYILVDYDEINNGGEPVKLLYPDIIDPYLDFHEYYSKDCPNEAAIKENIKKLNL